jgi:hypothetical protein
MNYSTVAANKANHSSYFDNYNNCNSTSINNSINKSESSNHSDNTVSSSKIATSSETNLINISPIDSIKSNPVKSNQKPINSASTPVYSTQNPVVSTQNPVYSFCSPTTCIVSDNNNNNNNMTSPTLPDGWEQVMTSDGSIYYYHKITRVSRWDLPTIDVVNAVDNRLQQSLSKMNDAVKKRIHEIDNEQKIKLEKESQILLSQVKSLLIVIKIHFIIHHYRCYC